MAVEDYQTWAHDASTLGEIGRCLFTQSTLVTVRLPLDLADSAVAAWEREDSGDAMCADETVEQRTTRDRAGFLGLIGSAVQERGVRRNDHVIVELDAWEIGAAYEAAEEAGLLKGVYSPKSPAPRSPNT